MKEMSFMSKGIINFISEQRKWIIGGAFQILWFHEYSIFMRMDSYALMNI